MEEIFYLVTYDNDSTIRIKRNSRTYFDEKTKFLTGSIRNINNIEKAISINLEYVKSVVEIDA